MHQRRQSFDAAVLENATVELRANSQLRRMRSDSSLVADSLADRRLVLSHATVSEFVPVRRSSGQRQKKYSHRYIRITDERTPEQPDDLVASGAEQQPQSATSQADLERWLSSSVHGSFTDRIASSDDGAVGTLAFFTTRLANEKLNDNAFVQEFLLTYLYFTTNRELLSSLVHRYVTLLGEVPLSGASSSAEAQACVGPVRVRVVNFIKKWVESHFSQLTADGRDAVSAVLAFVEGVVIHRFKQWGTMLSQLIIEQRDKWATKAIEAAMPLETLAHQLLLRHERESAHRMPAPKGAKDDSALRHGWIVAKDALKWSADIIAAEKPTDAAKAMNALVQLRFFEIKTERAADGRPALYYVYRKAADDAKLPKPLVTPQQRLADSFQLIDLHPIELARQLSLLEQEFFLRIDPPRDMVNISDTKSAPVARWTQWSNRLASWVQNEVLTKREAAVQKDVIQHWIMVADECRRLRNYSSMVSIIYGLEHPLISRLKAVWKEVPKRMLKKKEEMSLISTPINNFKNLRTIFDVQEPPLVPYFPVYIKDVSLMELNNPTFIDGMINFRKFSMIAGVFDTLFRFQQEEYGLLRLCAITNWMLEMPLLSEEELEQLADVPKAATTTSGSSTSPKKKKRALNTMFARGPVDGSESPSQFKDQLLQQLQQQQQQQSQPLHGTSGESSLLVRKKKSKKRKSSKADAAQIAVELEELRKQRRRPGSSSSREPWAEGELEAWLSKHELEQWYTVLVEQEIQPEVMPLLELQDLTEFCHVPIGAARRLLAAIEQDRHLFPVARGTSAVTALEIRSILDQLTELVQLIEVSD